MADWFDSPQDSLFDQELMRGIYDPKLDFETRSTFMDVQDLREKARSVGIDPQQAEPRESLLWKALDFISTPLFATAGVVDALQKGDFLDEKVGLGIKRGIEQKITTSDLLANAGVTNPYVKGIGGFAGDVLLDPLSWVTLGTGGVAKAGGRALAEGGMALKGTIEASLAATQGLNKAENVGEAVDNIFRALHQYTDASSALAKTSSEAVQTELRTQMAKAVQQIEPYQFIPELNDLTGLAKNDLFARPAINISKSLPFLGHFIGTAEEGIAREVISDPGPIGQAFQALGEVWKPGKVKIASLDIPDEVLGAIDNVRLFANAKLADVAESLSNVPVLGAGVEVAKKVGKALSVTNEAFMRTFFRKTLTGKDAADDTLRYVDNTAHANLVGMARTSEALGDDLLKNPDLMTAAALQLDSLVMPAVAQAEKVAAKDGANNLLNLINKVRTTGELGDLDPQAFAAELNRIPQVEDTFRAGYKAFMAAPEAMPGIKDAVTRAVNHFDNLLLEETGAGLKIGFVGAYLPHRYISEAKSAAGLERGAFQATKARKYETLTEAFDTSGKVGSLSLPDLMASRTRASVIMQQQQEYAKRLLTHSSLDPQNLKALYLEAYQNPTGDAAKLLHRKGIDVDRALVGKAISDQMKGSAIVTAQRAMTKNIDELGDPAVHGVVLKAIQDMKRATDEALLRSGTLPKDFHLPDDLLGEIATKVTLPGAGVRVQSGRHMIASPIDTSIKDPSPFTGTAHFKDRLDRARAGQVGERVTEVYMPPQVARAFQETIAHKDWVKEKFAGSKFGTAVLGAMDNTANFLKRMVTIPFPQYWAQNYLGDRMRQMMEGAEAMSPGLYSEAYNLLAGKSAIRNKAGVIMDKATLDHALTGMGLKFGADDFLSTVKSFADMDIDKYLASKNSILSNLKDGSPRIALSQATQKFEKAFDQYNRVMHVIHRWKQGDTLRDAVNSANEVYYNYRNLSPNEAALFRRFYMFYGFMSNTTKRMLTDFVTDPGKITLQLKATDAMAKMLADPSAQKTIDEFDYDILKNATQQEEIAHVIGKRDGKAIVAKGLAAPLNVVLKQFALEAPRNFTVGELLDAGMDSATRTLQKQFAAANPIINAAAQLVSGKNLYFDKPLSEPFLRRLPSLNAAAEQLTGIPHNQLPLDLDAPLKLFLKAVPDGKGRLVADQGAYFVLTQLIPMLAQKVPIIGVAAGIMPRGLSIANMAVNPDVNPQAKWARLTTGINVDDTDINRAFIATQKRSLQQLLQDSSYKLRLADQQDQED